LNPVRYKNTEDLRDYLGGDFSKKEFLVLTKDNQIEETMFLGLRVLNGVSRKKFKETFSCDLNVVYRRELESSGRGRPHRGGGRFCPAHEPRHRSFQSGTGGVSIIIKKRQPHCLS
ncbi:MAG: hypothetical protein V8S73_05655, partial [Lachnospiraceae bacterium]